MREAPARIVLSWGLFFAVAWFTRCHVALVAGVAVGGCVACLAAWVVARMWWQGTETARLARHVRVDPSLFDDPDSDEWFVDAAGMIVDAAGQRV